MTDATGQEIREAIKSLEGMLYAIFSDDNGDALSTMAERHAREQTAATLLAALIRNAPANMAAQAATIATLNEAELARLEAAAQRELVASAVRWADALRAELDALSRRTCRSERRPTINAIR